MLLERLPSNADTGEQPVLDPTAFYEALWNDPHCGIYLLEVLDNGQDFRFLAFNKATRLLSPLPVEAMLGKRIGEAFEPDVALVYRQHYARCVRVGHRINLEEKLPPVSRNTECDTWWDLSICPIRNAAGAIHQLMVTATDITEKKQTHLALVESKQLFQQVIDTIPSIIFWKDRESRYLGCNKAFSDMAGTESPEQLIGKDDYDLPWKPEETEWFRMCDRKVMDANQPELNIVEPQLQAGGREAWLRTNKIPLHDSDGKVSGILGTVEDITEQKEAQDLQAKLLAILEATPDIIAMSDAEGNNFYLNRAGQLTFDVAPEQIKSVHIRDVVSRKVVRKIMGEALPTAAAKGSWHGESLIRDRYGRDIPVSQVIICHKREDGSVESYSTVIRDISDRKAAEITLRQQSEELSLTLDTLQRTQAQVIHAEKMSSLGQMVAGVAHEINNPVNFIHANLQPAENYTQDLFALVEQYRKAYPNPTETVAEAIEDLELDFIKEDLPKLLSSMQTGTKRIREIVLSLRNFSRLDESDIKTVDLTEGIDSTLVILSHKLKGSDDCKAIEVVKQYGSLPQVDCYPSQLNQVLMNILANAIDALEGQEQPQITIATEINHDLATIRIADNGAGIPEDIQPHILDPFFTTKSVGKGTGMGMSISYQIITEKHGGKLSFTSKFGKGTEFVISIPVKQLGAT